MISLPSSGLHDKVLAYEHTQGFTDKWGLQFLFDLECRDIPPDKERWLSQRRGPCGYFGGSEAGALLGLCQYTGQWTLWADKSELLPINTDTSPQAEFGSYIESYLLQKAMDFLNHQEKTMDSYKVWVVFSFDQTFIHPNTPFLAYSPDGIAVPYHIGITGVEVLADEAILIECKAASAYHREDWNYLRQWGQPREMVKGTLVKYWLQVQQGMEVLPVNNAAFCYLLDNKPQMAWTLREREWGARIKNAASSMWNRIIHKDPPDIQKQDRDYVKLVQHEGVTDCTHLSSVAKGLLSAKENIKSWKKQESKLKSQLEKAGAQFQSVNFGSAVGYWQGRKGGIDMEALTEDFPHLVEKYRKPPSRWFAIKAKKKEESDE